MSKRPIIICLCGSTRFYEEFRQANLRETLKGKIVLSIGCDFKSDDALGLTPDVKIMLDKLHLAKIDMADEVLILNKDGYIGQSTRRELVYAVEAGRVIYFLEPVNFKQIGNIIIKRSRSVKYDFLDTRNKRLDKETSRWKE